MASGQLRQRKQKDEVTEVTEPQKEEEKPSAGEQTDYQWLSGSYWLVRVVFIRSLAFIYCKMCIAQFSYVFN